jgi:hypothetical protein
VYGNGDIVRWVNLYEIGHNYAITVCTASRIPLLWIISR